MLFNANKFFAIQITEIVRNVAKNSVCKHFIVGYIFRDIFPRDGLLPLREGRTWSLGIMYPGGVTWLGRNLTVDTGAKRLARPTSPLMRDKKHLLKHAVLFVFA